MRFTNDMFLADVAAVYTTANSGVGARAAGRLIAPGLVLTAGHVVDAAQSGWKVRLLGERKADGAWGTPYDAELLWRGRDQLDLALLRLCGNAERRPLVQPVFASIKSVESLLDVHAAGFPAAWSTASRTREFKVSGILWEATMHDSYAWRVPCSASPDIAALWQGMSGAAACRIGPDDRLYLFGAIEAVPANFTHGLLAVAPLWKAFADDTFRSHLNTALGTAACIVPFQATRTRRELGIARQLQHQMQGFKEEYLLSETGPVPFGGRERELHRLNAWLLDPDRPPRMLVTAPAGRGKSALLIQWMKMLEDGGVCCPEGWQLAFMPISIRAETNRPEVFYEGLAARLAEITGVPCAPVSERADFRWAVRDLFEQIGERRVIVVIDGIDEALHGGFDTAIFPRNLPPNVRILLSARWQVGDSDSKGWLKRLGWERNVRVEAFQLGALDADAIEDVIVKLGAPVCELARDPVLIERLRYLTGGEPLLMRYYAEDLWDLAGQRGQLTRADLDNLTPGFHSYFERWFQHQAKLWRDENAGIDPVQVDKLLAVLAFALGPLESSDLLALMKAIHGTTGVMATDRLLEPLRRFVIGHGTRHAGYVLSHPKIADYLRQQRFAASAAELHCGFATWGQAHCAAINAGRVVPGQASAYALQFLPRHLAATGATPEIYMQMVENGWRLAWEHLEGGARGFAGAVEAAWSAQPRQGAHLRLGAHWRCALTLSSITSVGRNMPEELVFAAVRRDVLPLRQAADIARRKGARGTRLFARLAVLVRDNIELSKEFAMATLDTIRSDSSLDAVAALCILFHVDRGLASQLRPLVLDEALATVKAGDKEIYLDSIVALAPHLGPEQLGEALAEADAIMRQKYLVSDPLGKVVAFLAEVAPYLAPGQLDEALAVAKDIGDAQCPSSAVAAVAPYLAPGQLDEALAVAKDIGDAQCRSSALAALAPSFAPAIRQTILEQALASINAISRSDNRLYGLAELAPALSAQQLGDTLAAAEAGGNDEMDNEEYYSSALIALAPCLTPEQLGQALAVAKRIGNEKYRAKALAVLAPHLAPAQVGEALATARALGHQAFLADALAALAPRLLPQVRPAVCAEALAAAMVNCNDGVSPGALPTLASHCAPEQPHGTLHATPITAMDATLARARALAALVPHLTPDQHTEVLAAAKAINDEQSRAEVLVALAPHLAPGLLDQALAEAQGFETEYYRKEVLTALAPRLSAKARSHALAAVKSIEDWNIRCIALDQLAPHLTVEQLAEALAVDDYIDRAEDRLGALGALAPHLAPGQLAGALSAAKAIGDDEQYSRALAALAPFLAPDARSSILDEALAVALSLRGAEPRARSLAALVPHLDQARQRGVADKAFAAVMATEDGEERASILAILAPHITPEQCHQVLAMAKKLGDDAYRCSALVALAPVLAPAVQANEVDQAYAAAKAIHGDRERANVLITLAPCLAPPLRLCVLRDALRAVHDVEDEGQRPFAKASVVAALAPCLEPDQLGDAHDAAAAIPISECRAWALAALVPRFAPALRQAVVISALDAAENAVDDTCFSKALAALAPHLASRQLDAALAAADDIQVEGYSSSVLAALAPYLAPEQRKVALAAAKKIPSVAARTKALIALASCSFPQQADALLALIHGTGKLPRPASLSAAAATAQACFELGGEAAIDELWHVIGEVRRWYP